MKTTILTDTQRAARQARHAHLCAVLRVQVVEEDDGYTAADWRAARDAEREAEDRRMAARGLG